MHNITDSRSAYLEQTGLQAYRFYCNNDAQLLTLSFFLADDCRGSRIDRCYQWALDPNRDETGGNITILKKIANQIEISLDIDDTDESCVYLSMQEFINMLEVWKQIEAAYPPVVRITLLDGKVTFEALDMVTPSGIA